jgi:DNA modification methylase
MEILLTSDCLSPLGISSSLLEPAKSKVAIPTGKNPGNVWEISTKAHYGNEHFAIFPEDIVARIVNFASQEGDWILDPFMGRGTTGIVAALTGRNFTGIDLYQENVDTAKKNIMDAVDGKYDDKLVNIVAREIESKLSIVAQDDVTLETYLLADGSHPKK